MARQTFIFGIIAILIASTVMVSPVVGTSLTEEPVGPPGDEDRSDSETISCDDYFKFSGWWHHGESVIYVTHDGEPVENVTVFVEGELVGQTDEDGAVNTPMPTGIQFEVIAVQDDRASSGDMIVGPFSYQQTDDCNTEDKFGVNNTTQF